MATEEQRNANIAEITNFYQRIFDESEKRRKPYVDKFVGVEEKLTKGIDINTILEMPETSQVKFNSGDVVKLKDVTFHKLCMDDKTDQIREIHIKNGELDMFPSIDPGLEILYINVASGPEGSKRKFIKDLNRYFTKLPEGIKFIKASGCSIDSIITKATGDVQRKEESKSGDPYGYDDSVYKKMLEKYSEEKVDFSKEGKNEERKFQLLVYSEKNQLCVLDVSRNYIRDLPKMPNSILIFDISSNKIDNIRNVPSKVLYLYCSDNKIGELSGGELMGRLLVLDANNNLLKRIPKMASLRQLYASNNNISIVEQFGQNLRNIVLAKNKLQRIPILPEGLEELDVSYNYLSELPTLPQGLKHLNITNNLVTNIMELPRRLVYFYASTNKIKVLPKLPDTLEQLDVANNKLVALPSLHCPELTLLECSANPIKVLPGLPPNLRILQACDLEISEMPRELPEFIDTIRMVGLMNVEASELERFRNMLGKYTYLKSIGLDIQDMMVNRISSHTVSTDDQSAHRSSIYKSIVKVLEKFNKVPCYRNIADVKKSNLLDEKSLALLDEFIEEHKEAYKYKPGGRLSGMNYEEIFLHVWDRIMTHKDRAVLLDILKEQIIDSDRYCYTGKVGRIISTLCGFYDDIEITITETEEIQNFVSSAVSKFNDSLEPFDTSYIIEKVIRKDDELFRAQLGVFFNHYTFTVADQEYLRQEIWNMYYNAGCQISNIEIARQMYNHNHKKKGRCAFRLYKRKFGRL
jgi:hypothetical protein